MAEFDTITAKSRTLFALDGRLSIPLATLAHPVGNRHVVDFLRKTRVISDLDDNEDYIAAELYLDLVEASNPEFSDKVRYVSTRMKAFPGHKYWAKKLRFLRKGFDIAIPEHFQGSGENKIRRMISDTMYNKRKNRKPTW